MSAVFYKSLERYSTMIFQIVVQIVIARLLTPADFGIMAMMSVFINIAGVFIYNGFNMAVIQKKDGDDKDYSTALIMNLLVGLFLYILIFVSSPAIAFYYGEDDLQQSLRVLALILPLGSIFSVQSAIASRNMWYNMLFFCNFIGSVISGVLGVIAALNGMGVWALIVQQMSNVIIVTILLLVKMRWKPRLVFVKQSAKEMFSFGWKLFTAGFINTIYNELNSLVIGKKYTSSDLAFYTKGKTFPSAISSGLDSALQSVMLSAFSRKQEELNALNELMKKSILSNTFIIIPIMALLAICAEPITVLLLTAKWAPMVPYIQICCITFAFHPIGAINMQALAAMGLSNVRLKLEFIKKPIGLLLLLISLNYGPIAIAFSAALTSVLGFIIGLIACHIYLKYPIKESCIQVIPSILLSIIVSCVVYPIVYLQLNSILTLILQVGCFISLYIFFSYFFNLKGYQIVCSQMKRIVKIRQDK